MFTTLLRSAIRSQLIQHGPMTCSDLVRRLGLDPRRHKGTIHALMVDLEREGTLDAIRLSNGKRGAWFIYPEAIRKRDRLVAALVA
jgi:DNA-binding IclR family transcriptional regulator